MLGMLVDDRGRVWPAPSGALTGYSGADVEADAIWSRGFVYLWRLGDDLIVAFRPRLICRPTLAATFFAICRQAPRRVVLSSSESPLTPELFVNLDLALQRMEEVVTEAQHDTPRGLVVRRESLDAIDTLGGGRMTGLFQAWHEGHGNWTPEILGRLREERLLDQTVVVRNPAQSSSLLIEHWGKKRDMFGAKWVREARGKHAEDQPYTGLALWAARRYREVIADQQPRLDAISVAILKSRGEIRSKRYVRLLLPWRADNGDAFAMTVNLL
ncbi:MAG TPA: hypothetical protein VND87_13540 [Stellaceae bacterium]|nr:hypothetical protein [Stellaceae bacterium]